MNDTDKKNIKVLIVDDSAFMRSVISSMLSSDPGIHVAGFARDGIEAVEKVAALKPDIVTMDVEMPRMNGIDALKRIMSESPVPVIMVSSMTTEGAQSTLEALDIGAVDFIPKNLSEMSVNIVRIKEILLEKIKDIGGRKMPRKNSSVKVKPLPMPQPSEYSSHRKTGIVAIGSSTGGPKALQVIIPAIPADFPVPVVIAQHMPPAFTGPFAQRLNQLSVVTVKEAEKGETIEKGTVYISPGRGHMSISRRNTSVTVISVMENNTELIYKPSVDYLFLSVTGCFYGHVLGVILTGLGNDGAKGMKEIKARGGRTIAESEETCVVYGMPKAVIDGGNADKILPLDQIAGEIINSV